MATILLMAGCAKPEYWVPGLSLPLGSTDVKVTETTSKSKTPGQTLPSGGGASGYLSVSFNNPQGWDYVRDHLDRCLKQAGYQEQGLGSSGDADELDEGPLGQIPQYYRMYEKSGGRYTVMVTNYAGAMEEYAAGSYSSAQAVSSMGMPAFSLIVMEKGK